MSKKVSIIIVNYNGGKIFDDCLKSLQAITYPNWELILVDNGSDDKSESLPEKYKLHKKNYILIQNRDNLGFAIANNQGYEKATGDYILFLNNDTKVESNFLEPLVDKLEEAPEYGIVQPKIFLMDKKQYMDNAGTFLNPTGFLEHWGFMEKDSSEFSKEKEIFSAKGACMLVKRKVIEEIGLFDSEFGSYFEETDFCWRAWIVGYKVYFIPNSRIYHKVGFTSKKQSQAFVNYNSFKNRINSLLKNLEFKNILTIGVLHLIILVSLSGLYLIKLEFKKFMMIVRSIWWNVVNMGSTLQKRKVVQKSRQVSDSLIFKYIMHPVDVKSMLSHFAKVEANFKNE